MIKWEGDEKQASKCYIIEVWDNYDQENPDVPKPSAMPCT